jgi:flagellar hook-associated protein 2
MSLGSLGINYDPTKGTFSVDTSTLTSAMQSNLSGVQQFFTSLSAQVSRETSAFSTGSGSVTADAMSNDANQQSQDNSQISTINTQIEQAISAAQSQYNAFVNTLSALAASQNTFDAYTGQSSSQSGTVA